MACGLGLSTSWHGAGVRDGRLIVERALDLGLRCLEVEYRVSEDAIPGIEEAVRSGRITVTVSYTHLTLPTN